MGRFAKLPPVHLEILKLLWIEWTRPRAGRALNGGLTRLEIHNELASPVDGRPPIKLKPQSLKVHLRELCEDERHYLQHKSLPGRGGRYGYMINTETVVTWPSTAFLLATLWRAKHFERGDLVRVLMDQRQVEFVIDPAANETKLKQEIEQQLDWCLANGYVSAVRQHSSELQPGERLEYELELIQFLAREPDPGRTMVRSSTHA